MIITGVLEVRIFDVDIPITQYFTSTLYPIAIAETLNVNHATVISATETNLYTNDNYNTDVMTSTSPVITGGTLRVTAITNDGYNTDVMTSTHPAITGGTLRVTAITNGNYNDVMTSTHPAITGGTLRVTAITNDNYNTDAITSTSPVITGGTLT